MPILGLGIRRSMAVCVLYWLMGRSDIIIMQESGVGKFIGLMRSLTAFIQDDTAHQQTIYECLNSQDIHRLFESIHDQDPELRITAAKFITHLLYNNSRVIELLALTQDHDFTPEHRRYIIGGLEPYLRQGCSFRQVMGAVGKVKYSPQSIAWAIDLKTFEPTYYFKEREFVFDPRHFILGTFLRPAEDKNLDKSRYKIGKR